MAGFGEGDGPIDAAAIEVEIPARKIEPARIEFIAGQQKMRARIEDHEMRRLVPRRRNDREDPAAQIEMGDVVGPMFDLEKGGDLLRAVADESDIRPSDKFAVAG